MPETPQSAASSVRDTYFLVPERNRAQLLVKVAKAQPEFLRYVLTKAGITGHRAESAANWLQGPMLKRFEQFLDGKDKRATIPEAVRLYFTKAKSPVSDFFFAALKEFTTKEKKATCGDCAEALRQLREKCANDPYLALFERWVAEDCKFEDGPPSPRRKPAASEPERAATDVSALQIIDWAPLDGDLTVLDKALAELRAAKPCDLPATSAALTRANAAATEIADQLSKLAAATGGKSLVWSTREEFIGAWQRFSLISESREKQNRQARETVAEIVRLLESVCIHHRLPRKQQTFTLLARQAASEVAAKITDFIPLLALSSEPTFSVPPPHVDTIGRSWLYCAWAQSGAFAEKLQEQLQPISPALAGLLADVNWSELSWSEHLDVEKSNSPSPQSVPLRPETALFSPTMSVPTSPPAELSKSESAPPLAPSSATASVLTSDRLEREIQSPAAESKLAPLTPPEPHSHSEREPATTSAVTPTPEVTAVPEAPTIKEDSRPTDLVWRLSSENRYGLASHLASLQSLGTVPPSWIFEAALLGPLVSYQTSPMSERLTELFLNAADFRFDTLPEGEHQPARLLLAGAALRPALLAPQSNAASALKLTQLKESLKLSGLDAVIEAVAAFGLHRDPLHPAMLRGEHDRAEWDQKIALVRNEIRDWVEKAPHRGFNYAPAARIWREWTNSGGRLRRLIDDTLSATPESVEALDSVWEPWRTEPDGLVQSAMKEIKQRMEMVGSARQALISRIGEAVDLANKLFALLGQTPRKHASYREEHVRALMTAVHQHARDAKLELEKLNVVRSPVALRAAATLCLRALVGVESLLAGQIPVPGGDEPNPRWLLDAELLRDPTIEFNPEGLIAPLTQSSASKLNALAVSPPDWQATWDSQAMTENHAATAALLDYLRWLSPKDIPIDELARRRERELAACRHALEKEADYTRLQLDEFVKLGLCREKDYSNWSSLVDSAKSEALAESTTQFAPLRARLRQVRAEIGKERDREASKVRVALERITKISPADRQRILTLLESGDIHTANEYLDLATHGRPLPQQMGAVQVFRDFFGENGWLPRVESELKQSSMQDCWQAARNGIDWHGLSFSSIGQEQRQDVASQLQFWITLERQRRVSDQELAQVASALGLHPVRATAGLLRPGRVTVQKGDVQAERLDERETCVVAPFGSDAKGRYTFHLVWGELNADDLFSQCKSETGDTSAHLVLCFRFLFSKERRELAEVARKRFFKAIVLDRASFAFILAHTGSRFATVLRTTLPFSRVNPYTVSAGAVPPEVFYGRRRELESLADPRGSCFVYGGRQLGKTALLRALERRFHQSQSGRAAVFVDLKSELFSRGRSVDELWPLLVTKLKESGVLGEGVGASAGQEALFRHIRDWLDKDLNRRLLLLLDESDTFLEQDGKDSKQHETFPRCQRLKNLMEITDRRFKVVFAGLHNVQRSTRVSNHPLAHLGEAICVGPMLEEAESREARALVEEPLAAVGYFFENPDAVSRILALTNYYPSLIQIFCHYLLEDLRQNHATRFTHSRMTPPCIITSEHVQRAYGIKVRQAIHEKVNLTLHLDSRYELIAYLLAFFHASDGGADGLDLRSIRDEAVFYWPKGFEEMRTDDEFRSLLEEMTGLGILRQIASGNRFALRNPNVMMLLGTDEEIGRRLEAAKNWEPALRYEADKFRRVIVVDPPQVFSPLTAHSESELRASEHRVAVVYGLPAAGMDDLNAAMESDGLFGKGRTVLVRNCSDSLTFTERIASIKREPGHTLALVPANLAWDESWIMAALKRIEQLTSKDAFLTVLFVADPLRAAAVVPALDGAAEFGLRDFTLRPWHDAAVRRWLQDLNLGDEPSVRKRVLDVTGNWPILLGRLATADRSALLASCDELEVRLRLPSELQSLKRAFGVASETPDSPLRVAAESRRCTTEWICEYLGILHPDGIRSVTSRLLVGSKLGLVTAIGSEWEFDPIAARILLSV